MITRTFRPIHERSSDSNEEEQNGSIQSDYVLVMRENRGNLEFWVDCKHAPVESTPQGGKRWQQISANISDSAKCLRIWNETEKRSFRTLGAQCSLNSTQHFRNDYMG